MNGQEGTTRVRAILLGERLDIRGLGRSETPAAWPVAVPLGPSGGQAFLFRYGVAVTFGASLEDEERLLAELAPRVGEPPPDIESDELRVGVEMGTEEPLNPAGAIVLRDLSLERRLILADILAKSLMLAHYETKLQAAFDRVEPLAESLRRGRRGGGGKELLRHIGDVLRIQHKMVGRVEVAEKPEILWDHPELGRLFARLEDEYELSERARAIENKLELIARTAEIVLDLDHHARSLRVEWYVVALIVFEIILSLIDLGGRWAPYWVRH